jgi:hypothetical protein
MAIAWREWACPGSTDHHDVGTNPTKEVQMGRRERRRFTDKFKAEVVGGPTLDPTQKSA